MKAPKFSARLRLSEVVARARQVAAQAEEKAARRAETACLVCLALLLLLAACSAPAPVRRPPLPPEPRPALGHWYENDSTD